MIAAVITLALALAGSVAAGLLALRWGMKAKDEAGMAGDRLRAQSALDEERISIKTVALERAEFELKQVKQALDTERARVKALEGIVADEINRAPNADLDPGDVRSRIVRAAQAARAAKGGDPVPTGPVPPVPERGPAK